MNRVGTSARGRTSAPGLARRAAGERDLRSQLTLDCRSDHGELHERWRMRSIAVRPDANPVVLALAGGGAPHRGALPRLKADPRTSRRTDALYGAWLAAAFRASIGLSHNTAQRIRQNFGTEHARTHAVVALRRGVQPRGCADARERLAARSARRSGAGAAWHQCRVRPADRAERSRIARAAFPAVESWPNASFLPAALFPCGHQAVIRQAFAGQPPRF